MVAETLGRQQEVGREQLAAAQADCDWRHDGKPSSPGVVLRDTPGQMAVSHETRVRAEQQVASTLQTAHEQLKWRGTPWEGFRCPRIPSATSGQIGVDLTASAATRCNHEMTLSDSCSPAVIAYPVWAMAVPPWGLMPRTAVTVRQQLADVAAAAAPAGGGEAAPRSAGRRRRKRTVKLWKRPDRCRTHRRTTRGPGRRRGGAHQNERSVRSTPLTCQLLASRHESVRQAKGTAPNHMADCGHNTANFV